MGAQQYGWVIRLVSAMWACNLIAGMIPALEYQPSEAVNGIFMAIVGSLFLAGKTVKEEEEAEPHKKGKAKKR